MTSQRHTVDIGPDGYRATCPVPRRRIGVLEAIALSWRGRRDARRTVVVPDTAHTHSLHRLEAAHRRREAESVRCIDEALSRIDRDLARCEAVAYEPATALVAEPTSEDLDARPDVDRAAWAQQVRAARESASAARTQEARRSAAEQELAVLLSARESLRVEGEDVRVQWAEAYAMRAARYTRARFGRSGRENGESPEVARYRPVAGMTAERVR